MNIILDDIDVSYQIYKWYENDNKILSKLSIGVSMETLIAINNCFIKNNRARIGAL